MIKRFCKRNKYENKKYLKMFYVFSATIKGKVYWYKGLEDLPIVNGVDIEYHIYPVYEVGDKIVNLLRERVLLSDRGFYSPFYHFKDYLKLEMYKPTFTYLFIRGSGEFTNVFLDEPSFIEYTLKTKECYRIAL